MLLVLIKTVQLVQIDVVDLKALKACIDLVENVHSRLTPGIGEFFIHDPSRFCCNNKFVPGQTQFFD